MQNPVWSGVVTGAIISAKQGPQAMLLGSAAFAAFSVAMDAVVNRIDFGE